MNEIPAAKAIFDVHTQVRTKIEQANIAVYEAVVAMMAYQDPLAPICFNADREQLEALSKLPKSKLRSVFMTGVPIFALRTASPQFTDAMNGPAAADAGLKVLLESFSERLPLGSL
jgi:hypothetical protein